MNENIKNENKEFQQAETNKKGGGIWPIVLFIVALIAILVVVKFLM